MTTHRPHNRKRARTAQATFAQSVSGSDGPDVARIGDGPAPWSELYFSLVRMSWPRFIALFFAIFFLFNLIFAVLYALDPGGLQMPPGDRASQFLNAFFFSVHTASTVGYGNIYPLDLVTNIIVVAEIAFGLLFFAVASGLIFARFSRPTARILFSNAAVVYEFNGAPTLMLRAANQRRNFIFEASVRCALLRREIIDGREIRRFYDLTLDRSSTPVFALSWLIMHRIDETSPLFGMDQESHEASGADIIVSLSGLDSSMAQTIHARTAYDVSAVLWDHEFVDVISTDEDGRRLIDYRKFHEVRPVARGDES